MTAVLQTSPVTSNYIMDCRDRQPRLMSYYSMYYKDRHQFTDQVSVTIVASPNYRRVRSIVIMRQFSLHLTVDVQPVQDVGSAHSVCVAYFLHWAKVLIDMASYSFHALSQDCSRYIGGNTKPASSVHFFLLCALIRSLFDPVCLSIGRF